MHHMAMAVKPILGMMPPDPSSLAPRICIGLLKLGGHLRALGRRAIPRAVQAHDDELRRLSRRVVRVRPAQGDEVGERHHRHVPRPALAGHGVRAAASLHGRDRRRVPRLGISARAAPARSAKRSRSAARALGAEIRTDARGRARAREATGARTGVALENGDEIAAPVVVSGLDPRRTFLRARRPQGTARRARRRTSSASSSAARRAR